jgi:acyl-coenzyme A thioesterase PaaI-like protein
MDMTRTAAEMLEPIPANALFGIRVRRAGPDGAEVSLAVAEQASNVIGSLHSSGLVALLDAAGLAAVIGTAADPRQLSGVVPLGSRAEARFRAPARGMLTAHCALAYETQQELVPFWELAADRAQLSTPVVVHDGQGTLVCDGAFTWTLRRRDA